MSNQEYYRNRNSQDLIELKIHVLIRFANKPVSFFKYFLSMIVVLTLAEMSTNITDMNGAQL